jgi:hypothetical protein
LPKKLSISSQKYEFGIWDPGSEIRDPEKPIPDPGSRGQKGTRFQIPDPGSGSTTLLVKKVHFLVKLNVTKFWLEDVPVGSPMQLRDPSEGLGRKAFAHTEAVQTDSTQVSAGLRTPL